MASSTAHSKAKFKRSLTKKSHSWWWNSHISPKNSKWLSENLQNMDDRVNRMMKLIEEDADSFAQKAQMYYQKRPELIQLVEEFYRMYRALAERYDHVTGELRKNLPSENISESDSSSLQSQSRPDAGQNEDEPPALTDSDSDSESGSDSDDSSHGGDEALTRRIAELEFELSETKQKLLMQQEVNEDVSAGFHDKFTMYERDLREANEKLRSYEEDFAKLKTELKNCKSSKIDDHQWSLDSKVQLLEEELKIAKEKVQHFEEETSMANEKLQSLQHKLELAQMDATSYKNKFNEDKMEVLKLQERIVTLKNSLQDKDSDEKAQMSKLIEERTLLSDQVKELESWGRSITNEKAEMEERLRGKIEKLNTEMADKNSMISNLNQKINEMIKEEINGLREEVCEKEKKIEEMSKHLEELHMEQVRLRVRVKEEREEKERTRVMALEMAEQKREAIRQLSVSVEHYKDKYVRLRRDISGHLKFRGRTVLAS